ncbi:cupin domain-containing protein [Scleromatobacter humisilvae]|uniref:Cupin domain-containing protein n=1 Tax=Scleromatobacter humisilvae TaxID=2897159 RepID=A0A9X1YGP9_9BURK|nr:cupin domain-containing protein [Scleromatobacter humisilvae]MCK9685994.1 cupin domain-containing protein [Scleromatobacter humisilvae]
MSRISRICVSALLVACVSWTTAFAQPALLVKPLAERRVADLPPGELFWRIESVDTKAQADAAAGPLSLVVEADGKAWLFTLGAAGGATPGTAKVAEVGPIPRVAATHYLLRINDASGPPGSVTPVHSHPGSEAFFVLSGEQSIRGEHGTLHVQAGHVEPGHGAGMAMQVSSSGTSDLHALVMFVVDADKPFSSPAALP